MKTKLTILFMFLSIIAFGQNTSTSFVEFDGDNDYAIYVDDATLGRMDGATNYTIEAWIYPKDGVVAEYDRVLARFYSFWIVMYDGDNQGDVEDWYFVIENGATDLIYNTQGDATLTLDEWNHIAVINTTADGGSLKLYVNGVDVTTTGGYSNHALPASHSSDNLYIGSKKGTSPNNSFGGAIDELRLKNIAVTPSSLNSSRTDDEYVSDGNTAALFHFDENTGTTVLNEASTVNHHTAGLYNGVTWKVWDDYGVNGSYTDVQNLPLGEDPSPVELTSFSATSTSSATVVLNWETATEVNNYGFDVESKRASTDEWTKIGFVNGHGNSNSPNSYTFIDNSVAERSRSYRLKQIDTDGSFEYSDVIEVNGANLDKVVFEQNYPNPFNPSTTFSFSIPNNEFVTLAIYNSLGQKVADIANENMNAGTYNFNWNATEMTSGVYFARLNVGANTQIQKIMLLK